jgi:hypothetical protein
MKVQEKKGQSASLKSGGVPKPKDLTGDLIASLPLRAPFWRHEREESPAILCVCVS